MKKLKYKSPMTYKLTIYNPGTNCLTPTSSHHAKPDTEHPHIVILCMIWILDFILLRRRNTYPNIDYLAEQGIRFSQFKNTGRSCPSRTRLTHRINQHVAGMGWMTAADEHRPGIGTDFGSPAHPCRSTATDRLCHRHEWQMASLP